MNIEELREQWRQLEIRNSRLEATNRELARRLSEQRVVTVRRSLVQHYVIQAIIGFLMPALAMLLYEIFGSMALSVSYGVFGVLMGVIALWYAIYIKRTDYISMPTERALSLFMRLLRWQRIVQVLGLSCAAVLIVAMFVIELRLDDVLLIWASVAGLVAGALIGFFKFRHKNMLYKEIMASLRALREDD